LNASALPKRGVLYSHKHTHRHTEKMNQSQSQSQSKNNETTTYATRAWRGDTSTSGSSVPKFGTYGAAERFQRHQKAQEAWVATVAARAEKAAAEKAASALRGRDWSRRSAAAAAVEASKSTDPIMSVHEYLTLPKTQAETFLSLWVGRQTDPSAAAKAQGLRMKAALAVADGSEKTHPAEHRCDDEGDYYPELNAGVAGGKPTSDPHITVKEVSLTADEYAEFPGLAAFIKSCGEPCKLVME
jgi:hypothetical protein